MKIYAITESGTSYGHGESYGYTSLATIDIREEFMKDGIKFSGRQVYCPVFTEKIHAEQFIQDRKNDGLWSAKVTELELIE